MNRWSMGGGAAAIAATLALTGTTLAAPPEPNEDHAAVAVEDSALSRDALADMVQQLAEVEKVSTEDAEAAIQDTGPLGAYITEYWTSDDVGPVWVTYDGRYEVHAGTIVGQDQAVLSKLERELGRPITVHEGRAALGELNRAADYLTARADVRFFVDVKQGLIQVESLVEIPSNVIAAEHVAVWAEPPTEVLPPGGGGVAWDHWNGAYYDISCSVGFYTRVGTTGTKSVYSAAHCPDSWHQARTPYEVLGETTSASVIEQCSGTDVQRQSYAGPTSIYAMNMANNGFDVLHAVAGGYYIGQPSGKWGLASNKTTGTVSFFGSNTVATSPECPSGSTFTGIRHSAYSTFGDSGGTVALVYNGMWYLAGITSGVAGAGGGSAPWIGYIPLAPGSHICVNTNSGGCVQWP